MSARRARYSTYRMPAGTTLETLYAQASVDAAAYEDAVQGSLETSPSDVNGGSDAVAVPVDPASYFSSPSRAIGGRTDAQADVASFYNAGPTQQSQASLSDSHSEGRDSISNSSLDSGEVDSTLQLLRSRMNVAALEPQPQERSTANTATSTWEEQKRRLMERGTTMRTARFTAETANDQPAEESSSDNPNTKLAEIRARLAKARTLGATTKKQMFDRLYNA